VRALVKMRMHQMYSIPRSQRFQGQKNNYLDAIFRKIPAATRGPVPLEESRAALSWRENNT